jgi:hypothetical protein
MDWIKVLNRHILFEYNDLRDSEFAAWIKIMALTAELEHVPTREQMLKHTHYKTLDSLQCKLKTHSIDLQYILNKVLIDAQYVRNRQKSWKEKKQQYRADNKSVSTDVLKDVSSKEKRREREEKDKDIITSLVDGKPSTCPHEEIIALYHKTLPELSRVVSWTPKRKGYLKSRWCEDKSRQCLVWWETYFKKIKDSPFLTGNVTDFKADLEWVINQSNMVKILEGKYAAGGNGNGNKGTTIYRTNIRGQQIPDEAEAINAEYLAAKAAKKAASDKARGNAEGDDVPDFQSL